MGVFRCFTEKREGFNGEARAVLTDLRDFLGIRGLKSVRILCRYDVEGITENIYRYARNTVFSEPQNDEIYDEIMPAIEDGSRVLAVEALPGQYDQRADSCAQCIRLLMHEKQVDDPSAFQPMEPTKIMCTKNAEEPSPCFSQTAKIYVFSGDISDSDMNKLRSYLINPVEAREASLEKPETLSIANPEPEAVGTICGFIDADERALQVYLDDYSLAMDISDLCFMQSYFRDTEKRDPTVAELRVIDTYWSDHCRHTTFNTHINKVIIDDPVVQSTYDAYLDARREIYGETADSRPQTLMDIATIASKVFRSRGLLSNIEISGEVNACSIHIDADVNGKNEDWLLMFKNETHNHPTEVEPFGGAATCIGGAIRDPLSGRAYVYQAMRITGAGDPRVVIEDTIPGKLPQRKLTIAAARGYSSYGNQIGIAAGLVHETYHPGYVAKRMELGAVVGAVKAENIVRETPLPGDKVVLLGGRTGRDGIGGATGSSKSHTALSLVTMASEVQKGNALEERKIQRLFLDPEVTKMIKRCNDFGAGGVSVAVGELADGLDIDLSLVRRKYEGLDGTEIAISESQERMAVVVAPDNVDSFIQKAAGENLEAYVIAEVTKSSRMVMRHNGKVIVDLSRDFLSTNGAVKQTSIYVPVQPEYPEFRIKNAVGSLEALVRDLRFCSQSGLYEMFDGTVGASGVLMKNGGKTQSTPAQAMVSLLPVGFSMSNKTSINLQSTTTCSAMAFGFDPYLSSVNPFIGAKAAVVVSVAKLVAAGCDPDLVYLTFQEYFERLRDEPVRWGKPFSALLGAFEAQIGLGLAAIGGKDSMSGSFNEMDVPPTLVSFAIAPGNAKYIISPEFKEAGHDVVLFTVTENLAATKNVWKKIRALIMDNTIISAWAITEGGAAEGIFKMMLGNNIGFESTEMLSPEILYSYTPGTIIAEITKTVPDAVLIGRTISEPIIKLNGETHDIQKLKSAWESTLSSVFPTSAGGAGDVEKICFYARNSGVERDLRFGIRNPKISESAENGDECNSVCDISQVNHDQQAGHEPIIASPVHKTQSPPGTPAGGLLFAKPRALIFAFPGTNSEIDTARAVSRAGGVPEILVIRNLTPSMLEASITEAIRIVKESQMLILPGGFSFGDEPDGSAKFITAFFRNPCITDAVHEHLKLHDGLILGICNGFQALIKLGLVPFGEIIAPDIGNPTLAQNVIARHQARYVYTRVASVKSPWMNLSSVGDVHVLAISHGEGRFIASPDMLEQLILNGRIATQYSDIDGNPSMVTPVNPNGSIMAVEGLFSPDGRVFGKMGHTERHGEFVAKNIYGQKHQPLFESGVNYFK